MKATKIWISLVAVFAVVLLMSNASAFGSISSVEVSGVNALSSADIAAFAGQTIPVRVVFSATEDASDVKVKAWIAGEDGLAVSSSRFDVISGSLYSKLLAVTVPSSLDPDETLALEISVENRNDGVADQKSVSLTGQRESYELDVLSVSMDSSVQTGSTLVADVVVKNRGRQLAEDTYVKATIPALGVETKVYLGDLAPVDQTDPEREDSVEGRIYLDIPSDASSGVYTLELEAYNSDSLTTMSKNFAVVGASADTLVASPIRSKTFAAGEEGSYSVTIVNTGSNARIYELVLETSGGLALDAETPLVVVPAGTSETVKVFASASENEDYSFTVKIISNGELVEEVDFTANVEGRKAFAGDTAVLLTIVLAIIFVVLLVVLIVLLTRKPERVEDLTESYY